MFNDVPFPMLVLGGGVILAALFFGAWWVRSRGRGKRAVAGSPSPVIPFMGESAISERVISATRAAEIASEKLLDKQETVVELEKKQAAVSEVILAAKAVAVKNG